MRFSSLCKYSNVIFAKLVLFVARLMSKLIFPIVPRFCLSNWEAQFSHFFMEPQMDRVRLIWEDRPQKRAPQGPYMVKRSIFWRGQPKLPSLYNFSRYFENWWSLLEPMTYRAMEFLKTHKRNKLNCYHIIVFLSDPVDVSALHILITFAVTESPKELL